MVGFPKYVGLVSCIENLLSCCLQVKQCICKMLNFQETSYNLIGLCEKIGMADSM